MTKKGEAPEETAKYYLALATAIPSLWASSAYVAL
jgi:hypothetical protein